MKRKQKVDSFVGVIILLIGILYLLFPLYHINNLKIINIVMFSILSLVFFFYFFINKKSKDYSGLFNCGACVTFVMLMIIFDITNPKNLSICILSWVALKAIIKFKKSDYYNDRRDRMWKINLVMLAIFIVAGILTSINLRYNEEVRMIVIGFLIFIDGILEIVDPVVKSLI